MIVSAETFKKLNILFNFIVSLENYGFLKNKCLTLFFVIVESLCIIVYICVKLFSSKMLTFYSKFFPFFSYNCLFFLLQCPKRTIKSNIYKCKYLNLMQWFSCFFVLFLFYHAVTQKYDLHLLFLSFPDGSEVSWRCCVCVVCCFIQTEQPCFPACWSCAVGRFCPPSSSQHEHTASAAPEADTWSTWK